MDISNLLLQAREGRDCRQGAQNGENIGVIDHTKISLRVNIASQSTAIPFLKL
jgi:hypothetical protein